jgi:phage terminase small subunit
MLETERDYWELLKELTIKEQRFVQEYLTHGNATLAAKTASYAPRSSQQTGFDLLLKPVISRAVVLGRELMAERLDATAVRILQELAASAFSNLSHYHIDDEGYLALEEGAPAEAMRAVQSVRRKKVVKDDGTIIYETEFRLWDKTKALELLGKKLKLFVDRVEVENPQDQLFRMMIQKLKDEQQGENPTSSIQ